MADTSGRSHTALKAQGRKNPPGGSSVLEKLLETPRAFSYLQAVRLLRQVYGERGPGTGPAFLKEQLRVRPFLSLGFPATDITDIEELPPGDEEGIRRKFRITATFLGLYGPSSPLPTFYTEELLDERNDDRSVSRDFLDILNQGFFILFALAGFRYRLSHRVCEETDLEVRSRLYALAGLGHQEMLEGFFGNPGSLLRATGLLTQFPRSAAGLRGLLEDHLGAPVQVRQCEPRKAAIPKDQRCSLGVGANTLGEDSWIGTEVADAMGKIAISIGPMGADTFERFAPGEADHAELLSLVRYYCTKPLEFDLEFILSPEETAAGRLGGERWSRLGRDLWLTPRGTDPVRAVFRDRRRSRDNQQQRSNVP